MNGWFFTNIAQGFHFCAIYAKSYAVLSSLLQTTMRLSVPGKRLKMWLLEKSIKDHEMYRIFSGKKITGLKSEAEIWPSLGPCWPLSDKIKAVIQLHNIWYIHECARKKCCLPWRQKMKEIYIFWKPRKVSREINKNKLKFSVSGDSAVRFLDFWSVLFPKRGAPPTTHFCS